MTRAVITAVLMASVAVLSTLSLEASRPVGLRPALQYQTTPAAGTPACGLDMRVLVLSAAGTEAGLPAITQALEYLGTPYRKYIASQTPGGLTPEFLGAGCHGNYQAVIKATDSLGYSNAGVWTSALTTAEVDALNAYEALFKVRQVTWFTYPNPTVGFNWPTAAVDTSTSPITVQLSAAGKALFPYINVSPTPATRQAAAHPAGAPIVIRNAYTYLATALDPSTAPLATDASGDVLMAVTTYPDGRENLAMTFDSNPNLLHTMLFSYGVVKWATRGLFVGERHIYMSPQVDDIFLADNQWVNGTSCAQVGHDRDASQGGQEIRMTGNDLATVAVWQFMKNLQPTTANLRLTMAINGWGTTGVYAQDTLTRAARVLDPLFYWVSHTYDHETLDGLGYTAAKNEFTMNNDIARKLKLGNYSAKSIVTPSISGLTDAEAMQAAADAGIRYLVSDTSRAGQDNPYPNAGIYNALQPRLLEIPRRPVNLFYNVATPADWMSEYNCVYHSFFGRDLTYQEILNFVSDQLLPYLLRGENDPWMFHQTNLVAYGGGHTLLTDLLDTTLGKYNGYFTLPILSPSMESLGASIAARMSRLSANVTATLQPGVSVTLSSDKTVTVPITGLTVAGGEMYGGQPIAWVKVPAGGTVTVPFTASTTKTPTGAHGADHNDQEHGHDHDHEHDGRSGR